jgi:SAM-dependent methyltransferase
VIAQILFELSYLFRRTPWDTGITPPELVAFLDSHPPGRALDLGCGTGTNAITMTKCGWQVVGIDISKLAIRRARKKARKAGLSIAFYQEDVTQLEFLKEPFDLVLDIGCFHSLPAEARARYAAQLKRLVRPAGIYLLYAWLKVEEYSGENPPKESEIHVLLSPNFECRDVAHGTERHRATAWFTFQRKTA